LLTLLRRHSYKTKAHKPTRMDGGALQKKKNMPCILCCSTKTKHLHMGKGSAKKGDYMKAGATTFMCKECLGVPLCANRPYNKDHAWGGLTCFEVYHSPLVDTHWDGKLLMAPCKDKIPRAEWGNPWVVFKNEEELSVSSGHAESIPSSNTRQKRPRITLRSDTDSNE